MVGDGFAEGSGVGLGRDAKVAGLGAAARAVTVAGVSAVALLRPNGLMACHRPPSDADPLENEDPLDERRDD